MERYNKSTIVSDGFRVLNFYIVNSLFFLFAFIISTCLRPIWSDFLIGIKTIDQIYIYIILRSITPPWLPNNWILWPIVGQLSYSVNFMPQPLHQLEQRILQHSYMCCCIFQSKNYHMDSTTMFQLGFHTVSYVSNSSIINIMFDQKYDHLVVRHVCFVDVPCYLTYYIVHSQ